MESVHGRADGAHASGRERRVYERATVRTAITLVSESNLYAGFTDNLSEGGVFVATHHVLPIGAGADLEIDFREVDGPLVEVRGEVRWARQGSAKRGHAEAGLGFRFVDLDPAHRAWIEAFIRRRDPLFYDDDSAVTAAPAGGSQAAPLRPSRGVPVVTIVVVAALLVGALVYALVSG